MKKLFIFICIALVAGGCKYFRKSSAKPVDTITADTISEEVVDSAAYYVENNASVPKVSSSAQSAVNGTYYMIVGCFTVSENADKYADKLRGMGYQSQIIPGGNNFKMVAAATYSSYKESVDAISKFRNDVTPNAWVFLKK
jgi:hypothetical protein